MALLQQNRNEEENEQDDYQDQRMFSMEWQIKQLKKEINSKNSEIDVILSPCCLTQRPIVESAAKSKKMRANDHIPTQRSK